MAFCTACGQHAGEASFCPQCGAPQGAAQGGAVAAPATVGMEENVAGLLCYVFGWVSGLILLLIDKRPFVRFHGAQSIALNICFVAAWIVYLILSFFLTLVTAAMHFPIGVLSFFLVPVVGLAFLATWILMMVKAYNHEKFKLPVIGDIVEKVVAQQ